MTLFAVTNGVVTSYVYNSDGIRTQKIHYDETAEYVGTTKYTLDGNKIVAENRLGTNIYYTYDDKGSVMGMVYGGESYLFSKNLQGDVIGIYNDNRQLVAKYEYSAFGEITAITNASGTDVSANATHIANINPFRYRGYYYDTETGFYYLITRYYDPVVGRFISADGFVVTPSGNILSANMFAYCENHPIGRRDNNGEWFGLDDLIAGAVGAVVGLASQLVSDVVNSVSSGSWEFSSGETYFGAAVGGAVGGVASLYVSPTVGVAIGTATSSLVTQVVENITGDEDCSAMEIVGNVIKDTVEATVVSKILPVNLPGVTSGRNSMSSVYKSGLTKLGNKTASKMSLKVIGKGVASQFTGDLSIAIVSGIDCDFNSSKEDSKKQNTFNAPLYWAEP